MDFSIIVLIGFVVVFVLTIAGMMRLTVKAEKECEDNSVVTSETREKHITLTRLAAIILVGIVVCLCVMLIARDVSTYANVDATTAPPETTVEVDKTTEPETTDPITEPAEEVTEPPTEPETEPPTEPETTNPTSKVDPSELEMLACVIYQEAGADFCCDDCRRRVADVVLNRVNSEYFPNTIYEVLTAKNQYGRFHWTGIVWPEYSNSESEAHAVTRAYRIASEVLQGQHSELYGNGYIWQAEFVQGKDGFWCCGIYFGR